MSYGNLGLNIPAGYDENGKLQGERGSSYNMKKEAWFIERKALFDEYKNLQFQLRSSPDNCDLNRLRYLKNYLNIR